MLVYFGCDTPDAMQTGTPTETSDEEQKTWNVHKCTTGYMITELYC